MSTEFTRLSSKGQVVIPQGIRKELHLHEGASLAVIAQGGSILLKKVEMPKIKSWDEVAKPFVEAAKKSNFSEDDLEKLISETRRQRH